MKFACYLLHNYSTGAFCARVETLSYNFSTKLTKKRQYPHDRTTEWVPANVDFVRAFFIKSSSFQAKSSHIKNCSAW